MRIDMNTTHLLNGLCGSTRIRSKHDYTQSKPVKIMFSSCYVNVSCQILSGLMPMSRNNGPLQSVFSKTVLENDF